MSAPAIRMYSPSHIDTPPPNGAIPPLLPSFNIASASHILAALPHASSFIAPTRVLQITCSPFCSANPVSAAPPPVQRGAGMVRSSCTTRIENDSVYMRRDSWNAALHRGRAWTSSAGARRYSVLRVGGDSAETALAISERTRVAREGQRMMLDMVHRPTGGLSYSAANDCSICWLLASVSFSSGSGRRYVHSLNGAFASRAHSSDKINAP